jgi:drug/metabolite transporter (DMT)-like permease
MAQTHVDAPLSELFSDLVQETSTLARQEVQLAKAELRQSAEQVGKSVASLAVGGAVAYAGFLAVLAAIILGLGEAGVPWWLSALAVGIVVAGIGYLLIARARAGLQADNLIPQTTIETLKEDGEWARNQVR